MAYIPSNDFDFNTVLDSPYVPSNDFNVAELGQLGPPSPVAITLSSVLNVDNFLLLSSILNVDNSLQLGTVFDVRNDTILDLQLPVEVANDHTLDLGLIAGEPVSNSVSLPLSLSVNIGHTLDLSMPPTVNQGVVLNLGLIDNVSQDLIVNLSLLNFDPVSNFNKIHLGLEDTSSLLINSVPTILKGIDSIEAFSGSVSTSESDLLWECSLKIVDEGIFNLFNINDSFSVNIFGEIYNFILESKNSSRATSGDSKTVGFNIKGSSPGLNYLSPRHSGFTKTYSVATSAFTIISELLVGATIDFQIVDWIIPAFRIDLLEAEPLSFANTIANASGALIESKKNGDFLVRYKFPISPPQYPVVVADHIYNTNSGVTSVITNFELVDFIDKLDISDVLQDGTDSMVFVQDKVDSRKGIIKIFPFPFTQNLILDHTADTSITLFLDGLSIEDIGVDEEEIIEIVNGEGSTSSPIFQIISPTYLNDNLGGVTFDLDTTAIKTAIKGYSLLKLEYRTRFVQYTVTSATDRKVQFILKRCD